MKLFGTAAKGAKNCGQPMYVGEVGASIYAPDREVYFNQVLGNAKSRGVELLYSLLERGGRC